MEIHDKRTTYQKNHHCPVVATPYLFSPPYPETVCCRHEYEWKRQKGRKCDVQGRAAHLDIIGNEYVIPISQGKSTVGIGSERGPAYT